MLTRARGTPYVKLDPDEYPQIQDALPVLAGLTESSVHEGNAAAVLQNGAIFPAMLADIEAAVPHGPSRDVRLVGRRARDEVRRPADREGAIGRQGACADRHDRRSKGPPHSSGCKHSGAKLSSTAAEVVELASLQSPHSPQAARVDGRVGYAFGHGIEDAGSATAARRNWRDTGVRLEGPVVHALQSVFAQNWVEETHSLPAGEGCFPVLERRGDVSAHVVSSASGDAVSSVAMLYTIAIAAARREVLIQNPYFAPGDGVCELFAMMVRRGVAVHLMVPGKHTDSPFVSRAGRNLYDDLLAAGVHVYEFDPTLLHQKIVVVDGIWSHVGSTNFDARSLALNEEVGVGLLDANVAAAAQGGVPARLAPLPRARPRAMAAASGARPRLRALRVSRARAALRSVARVAGSVRP